MSDALSDRQDALVNHPNLASASARLREVEATILDHWNYSGLPSVAAFNHAVDVANASHKRAESASARLREVEAERDELRSTLRELFKAIDPSVEWVSGLLPRIAELRQAEASLASLQAANRRWQEIADIMNAECEAKTLEVASLRGVVQDAIDRFADIEGMLEAKGYEANYARASRQRMEAALSSAGPTP